MSMPLTSHSVTTSTPRLMAKIERPSVRSAIGAVTNLRMRPAVALIDHVHEGRDEDRPGAVALDPGDDQHDELEGDDEARSASTAVFFSIGDPLRDRGARHVAGGCG